MSAAAIWPGIVVITGFIVSFAVAEWRNRKDEALRRKGAISPPGTPSPVQPLSPAELRFIADVIDATKPKAA